MGKNFQKVVELLRLEAAAVSRAAERLDAKSVEDAVQLLLDCSGKIIVLGVGKSGVIAQKIAQTMTSTGTVAVYIHPSDALHGSLGAISDGDVIIALSNSGETEELLIMLPALKRRNVKMISILGNVGSTLAYESDIILDASVDKEACPLNLAPTTSTTVALSIGDALAMALMEAKGQTPEDFAANHPAGRLGKRLTVRVKDLMQASPNISPDAGWLTVIKAISDASLGAVNVVNNENKLLGIITDGDLRRTIERTDPTELGALKAEMMMTHSPCSTKPEILAFEALKQMQERTSQISVLPVINETDKCIGMLRLHDIVRAGL